MEPLNKPELKEDCLYYRDKICTLDYNKRECEWKCSRYEETNWAKGIVPLFVILIVLVFIICDLLFLK